MQATEVTGLKLWRLFSKLQIEQSLPRLICRLICLLFEVSILSQIKQIKRRVTDISCDWNCLQCGLKKTTR